MLKSVRTNPVETSSVSHEIKKVDGFRVEKDNLTRNKVFLEKGLAKIHVTVRNGERIKYKQVTTKVFNTKDWVTKPSERSEKLMLTLMSTGRDQRKIWD